jgi:alpha-1,2-mannosyltransferase
MSIPLTARTRTSALPSLAFILAALSVLAALAYFLRWGHRDGLDLQVYRAGIDAWRKGGDPYLQNFTIHQLPFTYPPFALLGLAPLSFMPLPIALAILWLGSIGALTLSIYVVAVRGGQPRSWRLAVRSVGWASLAALAIEPVRSTLDYGQINVLLMAMVVVDALVVPKRHRGWLIGMAAAIKLTPLVFLLLPLLERDWKTLGRSFTTFIGALGLTWVLWPTSVEASWFKVMFAARRVGNVASVGNQSLLGLVHRWPFALEGRMIIWMAASAVTICMGANVAHQRLTSNDRVLALLSISFVGLLISPISWTHHWVWIALIPAVLFNDEGRKLASPIKVMLWTLLGVAILAPYWWHSQGRNYDTFGGSLTVAAFALVAVWCWIEFDEHTSSFPSRKSSPVPLSGISGRHSGLVPSHGDALPG